MSGKKVINKRRIKADKGEAISIQSSINCKSYSEFPEGENVQFKYISDVHWSFLLAEKVK